MTRSASRSPSHRSVPIRGRTVRSAYDERRVASSSAVRWLTQTVLVGSSAATRSVSSRSTSARWRPEASGRCRATPSSRPPRSCFATRPQLLGGHAVPAHRGLELEHEPGVRLRLEQTGQVVGTAHRVDHPPAERGVGRRVEGPPRREHEQVAGVPVRDLGQLLVGADGERVDTQPLRLAGQPAEREAVAVALGHRHQPGCDLGEVAQVGAPALAVDGEDQAHGLPPSHVEVEGLVERLVQRQVPLAGVLDGLAAGADLELDQADVAVLGVEGRRDAAQVVDVGTGRRSRRGASPTGRRSSRGRRASRSRRRRRSTRRARRRGP